MLNAVNPVNREAHMNSRPVNDSVVKSLLAILGENTVLVPIPRGSKIPRHKEWQKATVETMREAAYLRRLESGCNIGVLVGTPSGGLCSIDIDSDDAVEPFLDLNPDLRKTLQTRGKRGCNIWIRIQGDFPPSCQIRDDAEQPWGEWRANGFVTTIRGMHKSGVEYQALGGENPVTLPFPDIVWPEDLVLPWVINDDSFADLEKRFGPPAFFKKSKEGTVAMKEINQGFWAGSYEVEHIALYEPNEKEFYRYDAETGLYLLESDDSIKQVISSRLLEVSRANPKYFKLVEFRRDRDLNAITAQLRGVLEKRDAFIKSQRAVHLSNCVLLFRDGEVVQCRFSPDFFSRNRSPIAYEPEATCPRFLNELVGPAVHHEDLVLVQKYVGQCLLGINLIQRIIILDGLPGRGKSQLANCIQQMVGMVNVTQLRTQHLLERFELFKFLRRTLLIGVDVDADFLSSKGATVLKGLVGGDWFDAEKKGGTGSFQIQGRFNVLMTSNCRLRVRLQGDVGAWRRRLLIVRYEAPPPAKKIPDFADLLVREEGSGILNWAIAGLEDLLQDIDETGDIRLTPRQKGIIDSLLAESDSLRAFLEAHVEKCPGDDLASQEIVQAYADYCPEMGWDPLPDTVIGKQLPDLMLELFQAVKAHDIKRDGRSLRGFRNVALKSNTTASHAT